VLREVGVEVRFQRDLENHTKLMIADSRAASVGSINLSYTSLTRNREVSVIITDADAVDALSRSFDGDWSSGAAR
jgi:phosphatidylserine/phosphatidylglycerophosphate/cardiolipin synthase-like enzyme